MSFDLHLRNHPRRVHGRGQPGRSGLLQPLRRQGLSGLYLLLRDIVPADQLVVIHADLGTEVEWSGVKEHILASITDAPRARSRHL